MSAANNTPAPRNLPKKEADLFRSVVKFYEIKQYKKGIKAADTILKKLPNHGETQSMRGLLLHMLGQKEEAYEYIKMGLRNDVRSHVCWHAYGLMYRSDQNYKEAVKCFLNALRIEPDNLPILRDISWLQCHLRDFDGYVETRRKLLHLKPTVRQSWVAYAVSNYIAGYYDTAFEVVQKYNETVSEKEGEYSESEFLLFQNSCLERQGKFDEAISHLERHKDTIVDKLAWRVKMAELLILDMRFPAAKYSWAKLVSDQPDNYRFHCGLQLSYLGLDTIVSSEMLALKRLELPSTTIELTPEQVSVLLEIHQNPKFRSRSSEKITLFLLQGPEFKAALDSMLKKHLRNGIPSLYNDVCALVRLPDPLNPSRKMLVSDPLDFRSHPVTVLANELLDEYIANLKAHGTFHSAPSEEEEDELPTPLLWALFLKAHLLEKSGLLEQALQVIEEAMTHTPTALDILIKKAKILKRSGDFVGAAETMDSCRLLDLQDRYLNNKTTKYLLRANNVEKASSTIAMFTKHEGDPEYALFDLQCSWYELEVAEAQARKGNFGLALKKFFAIEKHFATYYEDQFDFHGYSLRKTTLRAYMDVWWMENSIFAHKFFQRAARGVLRLYLAVLDNPRVDQSDADESDLSALSPAERKKEKARLRKLKKKEAEAEEAKKAEEAKEKKAANAKGDKGDAIVAPVDNDPRGEKLLALDPLTESARWCHLLQRQKDCSPESHALIAEVHLRRGKLSLSLRSLARGLCLSPQHPELTVGLVKFARIYLGIDAASVQTAAVSDEAADTACVSSSTGSKPRHPLIDSALRGELARLLALSASCTSTPSSSSLASPVSVTDAELCESLNGFVGRYVEQSLIAPSFLPCTIAAARCLSLQGEKERAVSLLSDPALFDGRGVSLESSLEALKVLESEIGYSNSAAVSFKERVQALFPLANAFGFGYREETAASGAIEE